MNLGQLLKQGNLEEACGTRTGLKTLPKRGGYT